MKAAAMSDIHIRPEGRAGRITLTRPGALNALTHDMVLVIEQALDDWRTREALDLIVIDAAGDKAFCAGGDIQEMYHHGRAGDFDYGRRFWRDEYRMNAKIATYPKPIVSFLQGYTMGGGVGVGCHASHRIVCETSTLAMPEVGIGLIPDVGGSLLLARAPGRLGEFLGLTAHRMTAGDALHTGFADHFVPQAVWAALMAELCATGDASAVPRLAESAPASALAGWQARIDACFDGDTLGAIADVLPDPAPEPLDRAGAALARHSPLAMACTLRLVQNARTAQDIYAALEHEYRHTARSMERGDFLEGIRAAIIDRDGAPRWRHDDWRDLPAADIRAMEAPMTAAPLHL
jgi:enoyl-CoA hydratase/carnithine racemase